MGEIVAIGVDVVDVERVARVYARYGPRFLDRVFTPGERERCLARFDVVHGLAGRFAAKEAVIKALSPAKPVGFDLREIDIQASENAPRVVLVGEAAALAARRGITRIHVTISHERKFAVAFAVAEK